MLTYLEFLNENKSTQDLTDFLKTLGEANRKYRYNFTELGAMRKFYRGQDLDQQQIDAEYDKFKDYMLAEGFDERRSAEIYSRNKKRFEDRPSDYDIGLSIDYDNGYPYGGFIDLFLYEVSNEKFLMSGYDLTDPEGDVLEKYNYGWHKHKYGRMAILQQFESIEEFQKSIMTNAFLDQIVDNVSTASDVEKINEHYFIAHDRYISNHFKNDLFYVYDIFGEDHIVSYKEGLVDDVSNFTRVLINFLKAEGAGIDSSLEEYIESAKEFIKENKWPEAVDFGTDEQLQNLIRSGFGLSKYKI